MIEGMLAGLDLVFSWPTMGYLVLGVPTRMTGFSAVIGS
jgi:hypothetical protein